MALTELGRQSGLGKDAIKFIVDRLKLHTSDGVSDVDLGRLEELAFILLRLVQGDLDGKTD